MSDKKISVGFSEYIKEINSLKKLLASTPPLPKDFDPKYLNQDDKMEFEKDRKSIADARKLVTTLEAKLEAQMKKTGEYAKTLLAEINTNLAKLVKDYHSAVKATDGLTNIRPKTNSALQNALKQKNPEAILKARTELATHSEDVVSQFGKSKVKSEKKASSMFEAALSSIDDKLAKL